MLDIDYFTHMYRLSYHASRGNGCRLEMQPSAFLHNRPESNDACYGVIPYIILKVPSQLAGKQNSFVVIGYTWIFMTHRWETVIT